MSSSTNKFRFFLLLLPRDGCKDLNIVLFTNFLQSSVPKCNAEGGLVCISLHSEDAYYIRENCSSFAKAPFANCLLLVANFQLPIVHYFQPFGCCQLRQPFVPLMVIVMVWCWCCWCCWYLLRSSSSRCCWLFLLPLLLVVKLTFAIRVSLLTTGHKQPRQMAKYNNWERSTGEDGRRSMDDRHPVKRRTDELSWCWVVVKTTK